MQGCCDLFSLKAVPECCHRAEFAASILADDRSEEAEFDGPLQCQIIDEARLQFEPGPIGAGPGGVGRGWMTSHSHEARQHDEKSRLRPQADSDVGMPFVRQAIPLPGVAGFDIEEAWHGADRETVAEQKPQIDRRGAFLIESAA